MQHIQINPYWFFAVAELCIVLALSTAIFWWRGRRRHPAQEKSAQAAPQTSYLQCLETEIAQTEALLHAVPLDDEAPSFEGSEALKTRNAFLDIEREIQAYDRASDIFHQTLETRLQALLGCAPMAGKENTGDEEASDAPETACEDCDFARLKTIVTSQNDVVSRVRKDLETRQDELENYAKIASILDTYDSQRKDLNHSIDLLEARFSQAGGDGPGGDTTNADASAADDHNLRVMIHNQQATIDSLRTLIVQLPPEDNVRELEDALDSIQRNNRDLNDCVVVLEDDNSRLRHQLAEAQSALTERPRTQAESDPASPEANEEKVELHIRVEELEVQLQAKQATISELEAQCSELKDRLLEAGSRADG